MSPKRSRRSTVPRVRPPRRAHIPAPQSTPRPPSTAASRRVARIIEPADSSLLDVVDNLLNRGVVLNAEIVLALADVDLVYVRLSALLCAADRILGGEGDGLP